MLVEQTLFLVVEDYYQRNKSFPDSIESLKQGYVDGYAEKYGNFMWDNYVMDGWEYNPFPSPKEEHILFANHKFKMYVIASLSEDGVLDLIKEK
jgi:hypothetical protein